MEKAHCNRLNQIFKLLLAGKCIAVLNTLDDYDYMDPELIA